MKRLNTGSLTILGLRVAGRVPGALLRATCAVAADLAWCTHAGGVGQLETNLRRVRPTATRSAIRRLSRAGMRSYLRYYGEAFALGSLTHTQIEARVRAIGLDAYQPRFDAGETVILALGHMGNWDLAGAWANTHVAHVTTVAEHLEPEELFQEFMRLRTDLGMTVIPLSRSGGDVFRELMHAVRGGPGLLPLLADRDLTERGVEVELFGQTARVAAGQAALSVSNGADFDDAWKNPINQRWPRRRSGTNGSTASVAVRPARRGESSSTSIRCWRSRRRPHVRTGSGSSRRPGSTISL